MDIYADQVSIADAEPEELLDRRWRLYRIYYEARFLTDEAFAHQFGDAVHMLELIEAELTRREIAMPEIDKSKVLLFSRERDLLTSTEYHLDNLAEIEAHLRTAPTLNAFSLDHWALPAARGVEIRALLKDRGLTKDDIESALAKR